MGKGILEIFIAQMKLRLCRNLYHSALFALTMCSGSGYSEIVQIFKPHSFSIATVASNRMQTNSIDRGEISSFVKDLLHLFCECVCV